MHEAGRAMDIDLSSMGIPLGQFWEMAKAHGFFPIIDQPIEVWGLHGSERLHADGRRELEQAPPATQRRLDELREYLRHSNLGGEFEDKP